MGREREEARERTAETFFPTESRRVKEVEGKAMDKGKPGKPDGIA